MWNNFLAEIVKYLPSVDVKWNKSPHADPQSSQTRFGEPLSRAAAHFTREAYFTHEVHFTNPARDLFHWKKPFAYAGYHKEVYGYWCNGQGKTDSCRWFCFYPPFLLLLSDGVKHSDMRKVYVNLLCGGFAMLCAFFVYHNLGYKGTDDLGRERFDIDEFFCEGYELLYIIRRFFQMLDFFSWIRLYGCYIVCFGQICFFAYWRLLQNVL